MKQTKKFKGTKFEWKYDIPSSVKLEGKLINACDLANEDGKYVATVYGNTPRVCTANAKLMVASLDVLLALQAYVADDVSGSLKNQNAIAAIDKALK